jgi:hypothetical protein
VELLLGLSFEAYRRTATYLTLRGKGAHAGRSTVPVSTESDLKEALSRAAVTTEAHNYSVAALSPQEDKSCKLPNGSNPASTAR